MPTKDCVLCGKPVEDCSVHGIKLTICCKECCENESIREGKKRCSDIRAMDEFGCRKSDLKQLNGTGESDPFFRDVSQVRYYLLAEVKYVGQFAPFLKEQRARLKRQKEEDELLIKKQQLGTTHGIVEQEIRPILRPFVLGDYLQSSRSKTLLDDVKQRYSVKDRASELIDSCKAHPTSALAFCIDHPSGTTETYLELKENMKKVFSIEGNRIMRFLRRLEKESLKGTILEDVLIWSQVPPKRMILFKKLEDKVGVLTAGKIFFDSACQRRINRGGEVTQVAEKLLSFWKSRDNEKERRLELNNALKARNVIQGRRKANMYRDYIRGNIDADLDEVVGAIDIELRLASRCHADRKVYNPFCEAEFRQCFMDEQLSLEESLDIAMKKTPKRIRKR